MYSLIGGFNKVASWGASVLGKNWGGISLFKSVSLGRISLYGSGGYPSMGEIFVARERGPELVGRIGNKSAVVNNNQIINGIAAGVSDANEPLISAVYAVAQQVIQAINEKEMATYIDSKKISAAQHNRNRAYGV